MMFNHQMWRRSAKGFPGLYPYRDLALSYDANSFREPEEDMYVHALCDRHASLITQPPAVRTHQGCMLSLMEGLHYLEANMGFHIFSRNRSTSLQDDTALGFLCPQYSRYTSNPFDCYQTWPPTQSKTACHIPSRYVSLLYPR